MSDLYNKIQNDMKDSMKNGDSLKRDCLRCIISEIKNLTVNAGKEIADEVCMKVLQKAAKQRNDSIKNFTSGNRPDLADKEKKELDVIDQYLPKMLSEEQTLILILKIVNDLKIELIKKNTGMIMKQLPAEVDRRIASMYLSHILK